MHSRPSPVGMLGRICLDVGLTGTMLALFSFALTGLALHEWLGLALCVLIPTHLLVSWPWLAATTRSLLRALPWRVRLTYLLNASLFVAIVVVTLSGLVISEAVMPGVLPMGSNRAFWRGLHTTSANVCVLLMGLHLGVYWRSVVRLIRQLVPSGPVRPTARAGEPVSSARIATGTRGT